MAQDLALIDNRHYVQISDIVSLVLEQLPSKASGPVVIDFLRLTTTHITLVEVSATEPAESAYTVFKVTVGMGEQVRHFQALALQDQPVRARKASHRCVSHESYQPQGLEMTSDATSVSEFIFDLTTCMKQHWREFNYQDKIPLMRRAQLRIPFALPTGLPIHGAMRKLKFGAQSWRFSCPDRPDFEFSVVGLYQDTLTVSP